MKTILLVEDERPIGRLIQEILEEEDYCVLLARDGREGLSLLVGAKPDLIIADIMMPVMDGIEMVQRIRSDPDYDSIPVILMSAARRLVHTPTFHVDAFISKPFEIDEFLKIVRSVLDRTNSGHEQHRAQQERGQLPSLEQD